jgi:hypothetical protein
MPAPCHGPSISEENELVLPAILAFATLVLKDSEYPFGDLLGKDILQVNGLFAFI